MDGVELIRLAFREVHSAIDSDVAELEPGELFFQPAPEANHVGFLLWHLVRDEDAVVSEVTEQLSVWESGRWLSRLPKTDAGQGTGLESGSLAEFRFELDELMAYARSVWTATDGRLSTFKASDLDGPAPGTGDASVASLLMTGSVAHDWVHLGEIRYVRGLQGWSFRE